MNDLSKTIVHIYDQALPPPRGSGGSNILIDWLAKAQCELGHKIYVASFSGQDTPWYRHIKIHKDISEAELAKLLPEKTDFIEYHGGLNQTTSSRITSLGIPSIRINHALSSSPPQDNEVYLSVSHARQHGGSVVAYNGIPVADYHLEKKSGFLLFLAKVKRSKKGVDDAIKLAKATGQTLLIAGGRRLKNPETWFPWHPTCVPVGYVAGSHKYELLAKAKALIAPIKWEEPFGLTIIEAMASGTPVIAYRRGAMPELIAHGKTGFLCDTFDDLCEAVGLIDSIDPQACRAHVQDVFSSHAMAIRHLELLRRVAAGDSW